MTVLTKRVAKRRSWALWALAFALPVALLSMPALLFSPACVRWFDPCGNARVSEVMSPSRGHRAVVFLRDCGATTSYSVQLSILGAEEQLRGGGNAFVADAGYTDVSLKLDVRWDTDASLTVRYDPRLRVFTSESRVGRVDVRYLPDEGAP